MHKTLLFVLVALTMTFQGMGQFNTPSSSLEKHVNTLASDALLGRGFGTPQGKLAAEYPGDQCGRDHSRK